MKHWIIGGTVAIAATVLLFRSGTSPEQTIAPPTTVPATLPAGDAGGAATLDAPATTRDSAIGSIPDRTIAATRPSQ